MAGGPGPHGGEPHLVSTFGVVGRLGWGTHLSRRLGGLWAGSSSQGLDVRLASGAGGDPRLGLRPAHLFAQLFLLWWPQTGRSRARWNQQGDNHKPTGESERDLVGCVVLSQGALTWEPLALTPARPEARDAQFHPTCAGYHQALGTSKRWAHVAGGRHWWNKFRTE